MSGPFKMKGSPYPDKQSRAEKRKRRKAKKEFKKNIVVIDGKTYSKEDVEAARLAAAEKRLTEHQKQYQE